jgi:hypothetical protein
VVAGPFQGVLDGHHVVVAVRLDDAHLIGTNFLIHAKFVYVSDGGRGVCE